MTALVDQPPAPPAPGWSPVRAAVGRAEAALGEAVDWALWSLGDAELADLVVEAGRVVARAQGLLLRLVGEADARDVLTADGESRSRCRRNAALAAALSERGG